MNFWIGLALTIVAMIAIVEYFTPNNSVSVTIAEKEPTPISGNLTNNNYIYGSEVKVPNNGTISALKFWKDLSDTTTSRTMMLWDMQGNKVNKVTECTTSNEPRGDQFVGCNLSAPYQVESGQTLMVSMDLGTGD